MSWNDIPRWQNMGEEELFAELQQQYGDDPLLEQTRWIYVDKRYNLTASVNQYRPKKCHCLLWQKPGMDSSKNEKGNRIYDFFDWLNKP